jgi:hypothetical protein
LSIILQRTSFFKNWLLPKGWRKWATGVKLAYQPPKGGPLKKTPCGAKTHRTPASAGYHETPSQRKNWGSVHHTGYILLGPERNVKHYQTKIHEETMYFSTFSPKRLTRPPTRGKICARYLRLLMTPKLFSPGRNEKCLMF